MKAVAQRVEFVCGHIPDDGVIHAEVIMDKAVSHAGNLSPFDIRLLVSYLLRNLLGGFPDNLQAADERPFERWVIVE